VPTLDGIPLSHTEFRLRWPRNLFAGEARVVARRSENAQELLLRDAFVDPWIADSMQHHEVRPDKVLIYLADHVGHLPEGPVLRPTYQQRQAVASDDDDVDARTLLPLTFAYLVKDLTDRGYFARELTVRDVVSQAPLVTGAPSLLQGQLGWGPPNWPLDPNDVTEEGRLFDVIEVLHRHVARPRAIQPGWDDGYGDGYPPTYDDFSPAIGRAIYRHHVNKMLDEAQVPLRLADDGEDAGLLVTVTNDARTDLLQTMTTRTDPTTRDEVRHAISLFRSRGATREDKRLACFELGRVLEARRRLLQANVFSGDEDDLFQIANRFDVRHASERQKADYNPLFLDWVFWWFLATIELTDRLLSEQSGKSNP